MITVENYEKELEKFAKNLKCKYNKISSKRIIDDQIIRSIKPSVSISTENYAAILLKNIFNKKSYYFLIDHQFNKIRPDIMVFEKNTNNEFNLKYIFEIKSNIGYCRNISYKDFEKEEKEIIGKSFNIKKSKFSDISTNKNNSFLNILAKEDFTFKVSKNLKIICLVISSNNAGSKHKNIVENEFFENKKNIFYYVLFNNWYDNLKIFNEKECENFNATGFYKKLLELES